MAGIKLVLKIVIHNCFNYLIQCTYLQDKCFLIQHEILGAKEIACFLA